MNPLIVALATQRLTQLVVEDEITRPVRQRVARWAKTADDFTIRERIDTGLNCSACVSVWAAGAILTATRVPVLRPLVRVLAASQAALAGHALLGRIDR